MSTARQRSTYFECGAGGARRPTRASHAGPGSLCEKARGAPHRDQPLKRGLGSRPFRERQICGEQPDGASVDFVVHSRG